MLRLAMMINKKVENEQKIVARESNEVTVDWVAVQAEVRLKAFSEIEDIVCSNILKSYGYSA